MPVDEDRRSVLVAIGHLRGGLELSDPDWDAAANTHRAYETA